MYYVRATVKHYKSEYKKRLKSGKEKTYTTERDMILLPKDTNFKDNDNVAIISLNQINELENKYKTSEAKYIELKYANKKFISTIEEQKIIIKKLQETIEELKDHNQNSYKKALEEIKEKNEIINDLAKRDFTDYMFRRFPDSYKRFRHP